MRMTREELNFRVVVRRVATGSAPYRWEVRDAEVTLQTGPEQFRSMEAAYKAGQAWLADYLALKRVMTSRRPRKADLIAEVV